ncbi:DUF4240 domain-containing protein [Pedobacter sp. FW305-3-2-15-E-R2A2]|jgi:predicted DNA-binding WGR domain protein|uniref:DUF4240 domain-containing protein n=1 Tax=Pedobacter sp. FW305-3-2-15-E-R2A2 TaxID=3140251 RepID=UPI003140908C
MKRTFLNQEGESNKLWTVEVSGASYTVTFGKVGAKARENTKQFTDESSCIKEVEKLILDKQRSGYKELSAGQAIPEKTALTYRPMDEELFWEIIATFNWKKTGDDDAVMKPALKQLVAMKVEDIQQFAEILSEKLYQLDGLAYASNIGPDSYKDGKHFSVDYFLYVRCCVVANGKEYYERVLNDPTEMPEEMDFEALLYLADEAYNKKMGTEDENLFTRLSFETFSNEKGWPA